MAERDYSAELEITPPAGVFDWARQSGLFDGTDIITYRASQYYEPLTGERTKAVLLRCSACGGEQLADHISGQGCGIGYAPAPFGFIHPETNEQVWSGRGTLCPMCGAPVTAMHIGALNRPRTIEKWVMSVGRLENRLVLYGWLLQKLIDKDSTVSWASWPYEAYVYDEKKATRLVGYIKCMTTVKLLGRWEQRKKFMDNWGVTPSLAPWDAALLEGSTCEHSKLDLFTQSAERSLPVSYLRLWQKHKNLENLVVQGAGALVAEMMDKEWHNYSYYYPSPIKTIRLDDVKWKEKRPSAMLGLSREELRYCVAQRWTPMELTVYRMMRDKGQRLRLPEEMKLIKKAGATTALELINSDEPVLRVLGYLEKQNRKATDEADRAPVNLRYWQDYLRMAEKQGENIKADDHARYPADLRRAHDRVMTENRRIEELQKAKELAEAMKKRAAGFEKQLAALSPLAWEAGGMLIRPCANEQELRAEGTALHHCVASYATRHASGDTAIFFLRRTEKPDEPWYTLELDAKAMTVRQNRGKNNCDRTAAVVAFEASWIEHIRALRPAKKNKKEVTAA